MTMIQNVNPFLLVLLKFTTDHGFDLPRFVTEEIDAVMRTKAIEDTIKHICRGGEDSYNAESDSSDSYVNHQNNNPKQPIVFIEALLGLSPYLQ